MNDPGQGVGMAVSPPQKGGCPRVHVRLIRPGERAEWDRLMRAHH